MTRSRSELETIQFIMSGQAPSSSSFQPAELGAVELGRALRDDLGTDLGPMKERGQISDDAIDEDALSGVGVRRDIHINPASAVGVADQARSRNDQARLAALQGKCDADPLTRPQSADRGFQPGNKDGSVAARGSPEGGAVTGWATRTFTPGGSARLPTPAGRSTARRSTITDVDRHLDPDRVHLGHVEEDCPGRNLLIDLRVQVLKHAFDRRFRGLRLRAAGRHLDDGVSPLFDGAQRRLGRAELRLGVDERGLPGEFVSNEFLLPIHVDLGDVELLLGRLDLRLDVDLNRSQGRALTGREVRLGEEDRLPQGHNRTRLRHQGTLRCLERGRERRCDTDQMTRTESSPRPDS